MDDLKQWKGTATFEPDRTEDVQTLVERVVAMIGPTATGIRIIFWRTWRQRLFSWPWRPWRNAMMYEGQVVVTSIDGDTFHTTGLGPMAKKTLRTKI